MRDRLLNIAYGCGIGLTLVITIGIIMATSPTWQKFFLTSAPVPDVSVTERLAETQQLLTYFRSQNIETLGGYTLDEIAHLTEVANLFQKIRWLHLAAFMVSIFLGWIIVHHQGFRVLRRISRRALGASAIGLLAVLVIGIAGFSFLFVWFHKIFFVAAPWAFDPGVSKLVNLYPNEYFRNVFAAIL